ncbi:MAG: DUF3575 domain-containing protein, partial [Candidatus Cryptobacteroides sp.]
RYGQDAKAGDRFRISAYIGPECIWSPATALGSSPVHLATGFSIECKLTPVHSLEISPVYMDNYSGTRGYGGDFAYLFDLNAFATRKDLYHRVSAQLIAGVSYRWTGAHISGLVSGLRLHYNIGRNLSVFMEPRLFAGVALDGSAVQLQTMPSLRMGVSAGFGDPARVGCGAYAHIAVKTNLLYDAVSAVNLGVEVPCGEHWSVSAEWLCPWWSDYDRQYYFQIMQGTLEGRYWFGKRNGRPLLTGFFLGLSASGGIYDIMFKREKGFQGEFLSAGLTCGYAHKVSRSGNWRLEWALGAGYIGSQYRKYLWDWYDYTLSAPSPQQWRTRIWGLTSAKMSLVYMLNVKTGSGR